MKEEHWMLNRSRTEQRIRAESASRAIEKTIQSVEQGLAVKFPRGSSPTESREIMRNILAGLSPYR